MHVHIEESWKIELQQEFEKPYFTALVRFLKSEKNLGKIIYPKGADIFNAFSFTPFHQVKVLILGQDPYHGPGQAHGLSFSVPEGIPVPPSLQNVFKELMSDIPITEPETGNLQAWAEQGVLLLNATLTVEANQPNSHKNIGWQLFTDAVISAVSDKHDFVVFVLWGKFAQSKLPLIDTQKHTVLCAPHPSPFSANQGFFGSKPFSKINTALQLHGKKPIVWG